MHGNVTNWNINLMLEITEAVAYKIIVLDNVTLIRPSSDKVPVISQLHSLQKVRINGSVTFAKIILKYCR